ncbi:MAG TPA: hypothetical protein VFB63_31540 [Bryobacteraceae bacterium]|nr:hypothetical protein [Bryobacteraceae bacterium]
MTRIFLALAIASMAFAADADRDGLDDAVEQSLLEQFLPRFHLSKGECGASAAEFIAGADVPTVKARNGTIYGQAFPVAHAGGRQWVELHFHHLWARDCGRGGHELDTERVSALLRQTGGSWSAEYWYAAAHEGTVCDVSMARKAGSTIDAAPRAEVWVSAGKHASFLSKDACNHGGCGSDRCNDTREMTVNRVVNLGEPGAPMVGMEWAASGAWSLKEKMISDFDEALVFRLDNADGLIRATESVRGTQTTLAVGYKPVGALDMAARQTDAALDGSATGTSNFLKRAARGVGGFLGRN